MLIRKNALNIQLLAAMLIWLLELSQSYTVGGQILISENICKDANVDIQIAEQLQIGLKGIKHPVTICEIRGIGGKYNLFLPKYDEKMIVPSQKVPMK